jgi:hypothetical protein
MTDMSEKTQITPICRPMSLPGMRRMPRIFSFRKRDDDADILRGKDVRRIEFN